MESLMQLQGRGFGGCGEEGGDESIHTRTPHQECFEMVIGTKQHNPPGQGEMFNPDTAGQQNGLVMAMCCIMSP